MPSWKKIIVSGSNAVLSSVTASFQGNLTGTASFASTAPYSGLTGTVPTWNQNTTGNAATATSASFASTAPYSGLTGTVPTWNQNTTGNAATATSASAAITSSFAHKAKLADSASFVLVTYNDQPPQASQYWLTVADTFGTKHTSLLSDSRLSYFTDNGTLYSPSFSGSFTGSVSNAISASFAPNFANTNLSLNNSRTHNLNSNSLTFTATDDESVVFNHSSGGTFEINGSPTIQTTGQLLHSIVSQTGNIGIGTQTTTARLHVSGTSGVLLRVQNGSTSALMVSSSGNVGIGTTNPTAKLYVSGSSDVLIAKGSGSTSNTTILAVDGNNGRLFEVSDDLSDSLFSVNTIAGLPVIEAFADYTVVMGAYNKSDLVVTGSKIGIGTPNPQRKLDVYDSGSQIIAQFSSSNATSTRIKFSDANTGAENVNVGAIGTRFAVWTNNTERLSILSGGNVGIGSTSPGHALSVLGTVSASAFLGLVTNATSASFATSASYANNAGNAATANFATTATSASFASTAPYSGLTGTVPTWNQNTTGNAATATTASFASTAPYSGLTGTVPTWNQNTTGNAATATSASFATSASNARSAITASSADTFYVRGSVGIGIINPTSKLHVSGGNGYIDGNLTVTGTITAQELYVQYISSSTIYSTGSNKFGDATNDNQFFTGSILQSGSLAYFSGNVGIGLTAPSARLDIASIAGANNEKLQRWTYYEPTPSSYFLDLKQTVSSGVVRYNFSMVNDGTAYNDVLVLDRGNVGIGITSPTAKLYVKGNATDNVGLVLLENDYVAGEGIYFPTLSVINTRGNHSYGVVAEFRTNTAGDTDRPTILFYGEQAAHSWQIGQTTSDAGWGASDDFAIGYRASNDPTTFTDFPTAYLTVKTGGNVGIGTTSPAYKLDVLGTVSASAFLGLVTNATSASAAITSSFAHKAKLADSASFVLVTYNDQPPQASQYWLTVADTFGTKYTSLLSDSRLSYFTDNGTLFSPSFSGSFTGSISNAVSASFAPNFANQNLSLNGDRTHNLNGNNLTFTATNDESIVFNHSSGGSFEINGSPTIQTTGVIQHNGSGYFTGNIGIGTSATTTARLHVSASTGIIIRATAAGSDILVVSSSGNVGINTIVPTAKLHVVGDIKATLANTNQANAVMYNSGTGLLTYVSTGSIGVGTATNADNIFVSEDATNAAQPVLFASNTEGYYRARGDKNDFNYNPATNTLTVVTLNAQEKSFSIPHQGLPGKKLVYGVVEGPEHSVYVRGKSTERVIELPQEWEWLVDKDSITVSLTPIGEPNAIYVEEIADNKIYVNSNAGTFKYFYHVYATRKDVKPLKTIQ